MAPADVMAELEGLGTEQNRKIYARHGATEPFFGVSFANLNSLKKRIKRDHVLALELWATDNLDAMTLATMIAEPGVFSSRDLDEWAKGVRGYYLLSDVIVRNVVARSSRAQKKAERWRGVRDEFVARAGWTTVAHLAMEDEPEDAWFVRLIGEIETTIHERPNRTREAMNGALIAIGGRSPGLRRRAVATAKRIGTVDVDHGETGCKTPDACAYIDKMWARRAA